MTKESIQLFERKVKKALQDDDAQALQTLFQNQMKALTERNLALDEDVLRYAIERYQLMVEEVKKKKKAVEQDATSHREAKRRIDKYMKF